MEQMIYLLILDFFFPEYECEGDIGGICLFGEDIGTMGGVIGGVFVNNMGLPPMEGTGDNGSGITELYPSLRLNSDILLSFILSTLIVLICLFGVDFGLLLSDRILSKQPMVTASSLPLIRLVNNSRAK